MSFEHHIMLSKSGYPLNLAKNYISFCTLKFKISKKKHHSLIFAWYMVFYKFYRKTKPSHDRNCTRNEPLLSHK